MSRRQDKMSRVVKEAVSDIINNHLQDPRIEGFISITEVKIEPDLKKADVFLSIMGKNEAKQQLTFDAINHAAGHIQSLLGDYVKSKFCPHLSFHIDDRLKKTMETLRIIEEVSKEFSEEEKNEEQ
ncbi:MAG: 30S ribosome-binding factor RbfA [Sedimentisphaerales bacterium]|nr:30S ribosome-binding factor RbfA [Sedimentisphaerales bacterium]